MKESQVRKVYRMLIKGATTADFCDDRRLRNNWRARKVQVGKLIRLMGGRFQKRRISKPDEATVYHYQIWMPEGTDQRDPLGWLTEAANTQQDLELEIQESGDGSCQFCGHWTRDPKVETCNACFEVTSRLEVFLADGRARAYVRRVIENLTGGSTHGEVGKHRRDQQGDGAVSG